ncbi:LysR family transcriptional regulator [Roseovarius sp.]|uniref:LysR family transcriptional regulator n=1 Tax=Roseovarius sp. TaxID=1486281 RepID=UPI003A977A53
MPGLRQLWNGLTSPQSRPRVRSQHTNLIAKASAIFPVSGRTQIALGHMSNINLKLLQTFLLASEHGSFRRAAEESNRSASAVSMQIRNLEEQIGINLFQRTPQRALLTAEGQILFEQIRKSMADVESSLDRLTHLAEQRKGKIRIACAPTLASGRLGDILATFKQRYPRSVVQVTEVPTAAALLLLEQQEVEFYIGPEVPNLSDFFFDKIIDDPLIACVPNAMNDNIKQLTVTQLQDFPLILLNKATAVRALFDRLVAAESAQIKVQYEVVSAQTALAFASAGLGVCILPSIALAAETLSGCGIIPIDHAQAHRAVGIITPRGYVHHSFSEQLMALVRTDLEAMQEALAAR